MNSAKDSKAIHKIIGEWCGEGTIGVMRQKIVEYLDAARKEARATAFRDMRSLIEAVNPRLTFGSANGSIMKKCILSELEAAPEGEPAPATCLWTYNPDGYWQTACGDQFCITEGTPAENRMRYCHYCGRQIAAPASEPRVMEDNSMHGNDAVCGSPANNEKPK